MHEIPQQSGRAGGKVLLVGEHAVVHGVPAIALGLDAGVVVHVRTADSGRLRVPGWDLDVALGTEHPVARALGALGDALGVDVGRYDVDAVATVPAGAGLGSSAALAVAVGRALERAAGRAADDAAVREAAMAAERVFHGNPSGLDVEAALRGGLIRFVRGAPPEVSALDSRASFELVVAPVEKGASTGTMVAEFGRRLEAHRAVGVDVLGPWRELVAAAERSVQGGDLGTLGLLLDFNHGLLAGMGMSTPALDAACSAARAAGALGAKLTGAGGGGCVIALAEPGRSAPIVDALRNGDCIPFVVRYTPGPKPEPA